MGGSGPRPLPNVRNTRVGRGAVEGQVRGEVLTFPCACLGEPRPGRAVPDSGRRALDCTPKGAGPGRGLVPGTSLISKASPSPSCDIIAERGEERPAFGR